MRLANDQVRKMSTEDKLARKLDYIEKEHRDLKFSKPFLCAWEFSLQHAEEVQNLKSSLGQTTMLLFTEEEVKKRAANRTKTQIRILYARRFAGIIIYLSLQVGVRLCSQTGRDIIYNPILFQYESGGKCRNHHLPNCIQRGC